MTDREAKLQKRRIKRQMGRWFNVLGLGYWSRVDVGYSTDTRVEGGHSVPATTWVRWEYLTAGITFHLPEIAKLDDRDVELVVLHELCHLLIEEGVRSKGAEQERIEKLATQLSLAFRWVRESGIKEGRGLRRRR
jgi:hypothetical protein